MEVESKVLLTKPFFSQEEEDSVDKYRPPNFMRRILGLMQNVRFGSDLLTMQLPAHFNVPKSHLQIYGEAVYGISNEILEKCDNGKSSAERFIAVIAWQISTFQPIVFGTSPFNPILGETHHISRGSLNVLLEQISHHPPVTALHATDEEKNIEILWCQNADAKFLGTSIRLKLNGTRKLKLHNHRETYEVSPSNILIKFFPLPGIEWYGTLKFRCQESGLEAELSPDLSSFLRFEANPRAIKGKIFESASSKTLFTIDGLWDKMINIKDLSTNETRVLYNAKEVTSGLKTPIVKDPKGIWESESALVWSEVSRKILNKEWTKATEIKKAVEEKQRKVLKERKSRSEIWSPKHFVVTNTNENGWDCSPIQNLVPLAPIIVP